ncbi:MAG: glycosyltransferase [Arenicellales bacterium]
MPTATPDIPVFMCTWKRPHLFASTIQQLASQRGVNAQLHVWNNNPDIVRVLDDFVGSHELQIPVSVVHSDRNIGSIARFHLARDHFDGSEFVAFIDDDQKFNEEFLETLWSNRVTGGVAATYARTILKGESYIHRGHPKPGDPVNYCGPGGMILDSSCLLVEELHDIPGEFWMFDDLWFSYIMNHRLRAPMYKSTASVSMIDKDNDTSHLLYDQKSAFLEYLRGHGWNV